MLRSAPPRGWRFLLVLCYRLDLGSTATLEKGVRNQKCKAPEGPCRLLVPDPFFGPTPKFSCNKALALIRCGRIALGLLAVLGTCPMLAPFGGSLAARADDHSLSADEIFSDSIAPLFAATCVECHNDNDPQGDLSLTSADKFRQGGASGPLIDPGDWKASLLWQMVSGESPAMPKDASPLSQKQLAALQQWVQQGARWPPEMRIKPALADTDWWSLKPLRKPSLPALRDEDRASTHNPVDAFILDQLRAHGLAPGPAADRPTLIRRLYFDLLGLPPTPEQVAAFLDDSSPLAYENLVCELLASPRYGERWARHWLDVVHYGDTHGYDKDKPRPHAWPYRDYVIRSFNDDKPYAQFVREQLAGDVLWPDQPEAIEATGFIAAGPWDFIGHAEVSEEKLDGRVARNLDRDDMVASTMNTFVSTTVQCARCHDHKFDPVGQKHYYSLQAVFAALDRADRSYDTDPAITVRRRTLRTARQAAEERQAEIQRRITASAGGELARLDPRSARRQKQLSSQLRPEYGYEEVVAPQLWQEQTKVQAELAEIARQIEALPAEQVVYAGTVHHGSGAFRGRGHVGGLPREIHLLARGEVTQPRQLVGPGTLPIIPDVPWQFDLPADHPEGARRVALADWITHAENPLTWRSIVNRIWAYHFGQGIVDSPNDFGRMGQQPSHPELLDWLAVWFRDHGQSWKQLHYLLLTSNTYRQASFNVPAFEAVDAQNRMLWRMNRRPLDAEAIRDSVLAVSGQLNLAMFGPGFQDFVLQRPEHSPHYEYHLHDPNDPSCHRRAIYRFLVRSQQQPFMQTLDCADPSQSVARRDSTVTALQSLALLNNRLMVCMSEHFAERLACEAPDPRQQVVRAFQLALGRAPSDSESKSLVAFVQRHGLPNLCRLVFNLNEFLFVD